MWWVLPERMLQDHILVGLTEFWGALPEKADLSEVWGRRAGRPFSSLQPLCDVGTIISILWGRHWQLERGYTHTVISGQSSGSTLSVTFLFCYTWTKATWRAFPLSKTIWYPSGSASDQLPRVSIETELLRHMFLCPVQLQFFPRQSQWKNQRLLQALLCPAVGGMGPALLFVLVLIPPALPFSCSRIQY